MSTLKVNKIRDTAGSADSITLDPNGGAVIAGVTTVSTIKVGSGVTISSDGDIFHTGVCTATSFAGEIPAASIVGVCTSGLTKTGGFGKIIQVVQGTSTTENSFTTASFVASSLSATITPTAASSKILINASFLVDTKSNGRQIYVALYRSINGGTFTNVSGGSNTTAIATYAGSSRIIEKVSLTRLDTPSYSVGNSIVYKLYGKSESAAGEVTITGQGVEDVMILQEVAA